MNDCFGLVEAVFWPVRFDYRVPLKYGLWYSKRFEELVVVSYDVDGRSKVLSEESLRPSVLDRLLDDAPTTQQEQPWQRRTVLTSLRESVCRDLRNLLNSRRWLQSIPTQFHEVEASLVNYGLPDLQSMEIREDHAAQHVGRLMEEVVRNFEPRLHGVRVSPVENTQEGREVMRTLQFEIEAVLVVEPLKEPVLFTSSFDSSRGEFAVEGE